MKNVHLIVAHPTSNSPSLLIRDVVIRQVSTKDIKSHSWTTYVKKILGKYSLPTCTSVDLLYDTLDKLEWKMVVNSRIHEFWTEKHKDIIPKLNQQ